MSTKAALTTQFIIETAAPIFNKYGYAATSMSTLTKVTGLTKGAIYGNFKNKEDLAIQAFNYNIKRLLGAIRNETDKYKSSIDKLKAINHFYRNYYAFSKKFGGCPVLNVGVDSNNQNTLLLKHVRTVIEKIHGHLADVIQYGINRNEIKEEIDPNEWAVRLDSMIQGAIFMTYTMDSDCYLQDTMSQIEEIIEHQLKR